MNTELSSPVSSQSPNYRLPAHQEGYILVAHSTDQQASCPFYQQVLSRLYGFCYRKPTDLPSRDKQVQLRWSATAVTIGAYEKRNHRVQFWQIAFGGVPGQSGRHGLPKKRIATDHN